jgi:hypothetical protein
MVAYILYFGNFESIDITVCIERIWDSIVCITTSCGPRVCMLAGARYFLFSVTVQTSCVAHPVSCYFLG